MTISSNGRHQAGVGAIVICAMLALTAAAGAQTTSAPLLQPKPVFVPGMYETESRNSHFQGQPVKSEGCVASADYDAFRDETMAQYRNLPRFTKECTLSDTKPLPDGFGFAMQCKGTKTVLTYRFAKDMVRGTIDTMIVDAPKYSSSVLIMMRRVGECPGQDKPGRPL